MTCKPLRIGSRASLFNNTQPFFAVLFALVILSESLSALEIAGGILIFIGIVLERVWRRPLADLVAGGRDPSEADVGELAGRE